MNLENAFKASRELILEAGEKIMEFYGEDYDVDRKDDDSPLTQADFSASKIIMDGLRKKFPDCGFLSEEEEDNEERFDKEYVWIVDPLDGTKEFVKHTEDFTVNIALARNGKPVLGLVYLPAQEKLYYGIEGKGAFLEKDGEKRKIKVSDRKEFSNMVFTRSKSHASKTDKELEKKFKDCIPAGSALKGCLVADGTADVYARTTPASEWDMCAMNCVLNEAGGIMTELDGEPRKYNSKDILIRGLVASNRKNHGEVLKIIEGHS